MGKLDKVVGQGVLILALGAFVLSFEKLHHVALASGVHPRLAWIYPLIVEGFTTIATLAAYLKRQQRGAWYPWMVGILAFAFSLWANSNPEDVPPGVVRAVPVVCIPLMVHMYVIIRAIPVMEVHPEEVPVPSEVWEELTDTVTVGPEVPEVPPVVEISARAIRGANNFLEMARNAPTPDSRAFWEAKAAAAVV